MRRVSHVTVTCHIGRPLTTADIALGFRKAFLYVEWSAQLLLALASLTVKLLLVHRGCFVVVHMVKWRASLLTQCFSIGLFGCLGGSRH